MKRQPKITRHSRKRTPRKQDNAEGRTKAIINIFEEVREDITSTSQGSGPDAIAKWKRKMENSENNQERALRNSK